MVWISDKDQNLATCLPHDRLPTTGVIAQVNCERSKSWTYTSNWWPIPHNVFNVIQLSNSIIIILMHSINNTISSSTIKYCIVTKNIVSTETFLYLFSTIIYSLQDVSTYFMHINYSPTCKWCLCIHFPPILLGIIIEPNHAEVAIANLSQRQQAVLHQGCIT